MRASLFDAPGKATAFGVLGCLVCTIWPDSPGVRGQLVVTLITALLGCFNPS